MLILVAGFGGLAARAQDNYEIQVYGSEMDPPGTTTLELHSNFTAEGRITRREGVVPTDHAMHETLEVAHGFTDCLKPVFMAPKQPTSGPLLLLEKVAGQEKEEPFATRRQSLGWAFPFPGI